MRLDRRAQVVGGGSVWRPWANGLGRESTGSRDCQCAELSVSRCHFTPRARWVVRARTATTSGREAPNAGSERVCRPTPCAIRVPCCYAWAGRGCDHLERRHPECPRLSQRRPTIDDQHAVRSRYFLLVLFLLKLMLKPGKCRGRAEKRTNAVDAALGQDAATVAVKGRACAELSRATPIKLMPQLGLSLPLNADRVTGRPSFTPIELRLIVSRLRP